MNEFRKHKSPVRKTAAVDGFLGGKPASQGSLRQSRASQLQQNRLDSFAVPQGFRANAQPILKTSTRPGSLARSSQVLAGGPSASEMQLPPAATKRGQHKKRHPFKTFAKVFAVLLVIVVLMGGYLFGKGYLKARNIFKGGGNAPALNANVDPNKLNGEGDGRVNILLLGRGGEGHDGADLTDTILVASIDPVQHQASILSIPRDLWVANNKAGGGYSKINEVYADAKMSVMSGKKTADIKQRAAAAGEAAIESTVEQSMGIPIHYYVLVDFAAFEQAINTVGGVDITVAANDSSSIVKEQMWDELTHKNYLLNVQPGVNHFDGQRALMYSRSRHTSARGDFDRSERQRKMIIALKNKILSAGTYGNPAKINELINAFGDHVSSNLSTNDLKRLYDLSKTIDSSKINSLGLADPPNNYVTTGTSTTGLSIVRPIAGLTDFSAIQNYVRNALRDSYLQKESANIAVYNGTTTSGLATTKATELKSFGYGVTTIANAPTQNYTKTIVVDMTNGQKKYTAHYLEQRFNTTVVTKMPNNTINPGTSDFVIILGNDASTSR